MTRNIDDIIDSAQDFVVPIWVSHGAVAGHLKVELALRHGLVRCATMLTKYPGYI